MADDIRLYAEKQTGQYILGGSVHCHLNGASLLHSELPSMVAKWLLKLCGLGLIHHESTREMVGLQGTSICIPLLIEAPFL